MAIAIDPACGKEIDTAAVNAQVGRIQAGAPEIDPEKGTKSFHDGKWYYFCSMPCRNRFSAAPQDFLK